MKKKILIIMLLAVVLVSLTSQEVSEKKEIAVFALSYYGWNVPDNAFGLVDSQIADVFVNLGRFTVAPMHYRLSATDVGAFIEEIRKSKEQNIEVSEEVRLGEATFTEADFNRLTGSFIVVIPVISGYSTDILDDGNYETNITTSFTFLNVETQETFAMFNVDTVGSGDNANEAIRNAADQIAMMLTYEVRSVPEFTLKTGIVEVLGRSKILMEFGDDMGVKIGDEYAMTTVKVLDSGHQMPQETGLIKISEVSDELSYGYVLYSSQDPYPGAQLKEIPRVGLDASAYLNIISGDTPATFIGIRTAASRGFYKFRPIVGVEIPFTEGIMDIGFPVNIYAGGEACWYLGRLLFQPAAAFGLGGVVPVSELDNPDEEDIFYTHVGGLIEFKGSFLFSRDLRFFANAGFAYWKSIWDGFTYSDFFGEDYGGVYIGGGVTLKM